MLLQRTSAPPGSPLPLIRLLTFEPKSVSLAVTATGLTIAFVRPITVTGSAVVYWTLPENPSDRPGPRPCPRPPIPRQPSAVTVSSPSRTLTIRSWPLAAASVTVPAPSLMIRVSGVTSSVTSENPLAAGCPGTGHAVEQPARIAPAVVGVGADGEIVQPLGAATVVPLVDADGADVERAAQVDGGGHVESGPGPGVGSDVFRPVDQFAGPAVVDGPPVLHVNAVRRGTPRPDRRGC